MLRRSRLEQLQGTVGNATMMLEKGKASKTKKTDEAEKTKTAGEHDPLLNTKRAESTTIHNRYSLLTEGDDSDSEDSDISNAGEQNSGVEYMLQQYKRHRPNKRQRIRRRQKTTTETIPDTDSTDDNEIECTREHCTQVSHHNLHYNNTIQKMMWQCPGGPLAKMLRRNSKQIPPWRRDGQVKKVNESAMRNAAASDVTIGNDWVKIGAVKVAQQFKSIQLHSFSDCTNAQQLQRRR